MERIGLPHGLNRNQQLAGSGRRRPDLTGREASDGTSRGASIQTPVWNSCIYGANRQTDTHTRAIMLQGADWPWRPRLGNNGCTSARCWWYYFREIGFLVFSTLLGSLSLFTQFCSPEKRDRHQFIRRGVHFAISSRFSPCRLQTRCHWHFQGRHIHSSLTQTFLLYPDLHVSTAF